jgi:hypothetical protein
MFPDFHQSCYTSLLHEASLGQSRRPHPITQRRTLYAFTPRSLAGNIRAADASPGATSNHCSLWCHIHAGIRRHRLLALAQTRRPSGTLKQCHRAWCRGPDRECSSWSWAARFFISLGVVVFVLDCNARHCRIQWAYWCGLLMWVIFDLLNITFYPIFYCKTDELQPVTLTHGIGSILSSG